MIDYANVTDEMQRHFWKNVEKGQENECWKWRGGDAGDGYGTINTPHGSTTPSRFAMMIHLRRSLSRKEFVCHVNHCSSKKCCNPRHLYLGNALSNALDRKACRRKKRGDQSVLYIRNIPSSLLVDFKSACILNDVSLSKGVITAMRSYVRNARRKNPEHFSS